jgi:hypothetical protein
MSCRNPIAAIAPAAALLLALTRAQAFDDTKYPDWKGQWIGGWNKRLPGVTGQPSCATSKRLADRRHTGRFK